MKSLPKKLNFDDVEKKYQSQWEELGIYRFVWEDKEAPVFSIDTPPPYPSGEFHMGNVLNWTYFDIVARYKRMRGFNVHFPQGWDCHGLSIELQVEKENNIKKREIPPKKFRQLCQELVEKYIAIMKEGVIRLGCSVDWTTEYRTMDPDYWRRTQRSFLMLVKKGLIYQGTHPVNWCPRCETAIADAEVNYEKRNGRLHFIKFPLENGKGHVLIATTRPEYIPACVTVAINPNDDRFTKYIGKKIVVPLVNRKVEMISDSSVDPSFGTGVVMICTYGDKEDVKTVKSHKLPIIRILTEHGCINEKGGKYAGLTIKEARKALVQDLDSEGLLEKIQGIEQHVGVCDRCGTSIEILEQKQWFMKTRILTDKVEKMANTVRWYPDHMKNRLVDWAHSLDWDWVISRQRIFGTPIPLWYCNRCNEIIFAQEEWVPIDPKMEDPRIDKCPKCGGQEFVPEQDIFDTWMDSSITCAVHAGWPDRTDWKRLFPADLHPSGIDIIRTWAYYLMVRHLALFQEKPYKSCLINGMVLGSDGRKMSKSLRNYVATPEVLNKYGSDAARQWAAGGGAVGSDIPFRLPDVEYGRRFLTKLWNATRFMSKHLKNFTPTRKYELQLLDKWVLSKTEKLICRVTQGLEQFKFNTVLEELRSFTWHIFCDQYIEAVKDRLYNPDRYGEGKSVAVQFTLYHTLYRVIQLLAPITPYITEEIYQRIFSEALGCKSIHLTPWPKPDNRLIDEEAEKAGDLILAIITEVRREKAEKRLSLNTKIKKLIIYSKENDIIKTVRKGRKDISGTCKVEIIEISTRNGKGRTIRPYNNLKFFATY